MLSVYIDFSSIALFVLHSGVATGTSGIVSYDIDGTNHRLVIMWHVPFDQFIYDLWFNMKVRFPKFTNNLSDSHLSLLSLLFLIQFCYQAELAMYHMFKRLN